MDSQEMNMKVYILMCRYDGVWDWRQVFDGDGTLEIHQEEREAIEELGSENVCIVEGKLLCTVE